MVRLLHRFGRLGLWKRIAAIYEPMTALTDLGLTAQTATYAVLLHREGASRSGAGRLWIVALSAAGVAALGGSIHHTLPPEDTSGLRAASWEVVGVATGLAAAALLAAGVTATLPRPQQPGWLLATALKSIGLGTLHRVNHDFKLIIADYATSMLAVLALMLTARPPRPERRAIMTGILIAFIAAAVQMSGVRLHKHLNHNDLYHLVQALSFHYLYTGARQGVYCDPAHDGTRADPPDFAGHDV